MERDERSTWHGRVWTSGPEEPHAPGERRGGRCAGRARRAHGHRRRDLFRIRRTYEKAARAVAEHALDVDTLRRSTLPPPFLEWGRISRRRSPSCAGPGA